MTNQAKQIAKKSKSSFYYAFTLLPNDKREAMNTVYAFCRQTDDIIDEGNDTDDIRFENLRKWRIELQKALRNQSNFNLLNKLARIIRQFNIPIEPFFDLIIGMEMDLQQNRYLSFDDLRQYCYHVASTVGLMSIEIFGYKNQSTRDYAINLGLALQLTNILRDVKTDAMKGRIYLPQEDMERFNYSEEELMNFVYNENFVQLMRYEASHAYEFFRRADESLTFDDKPSMFAARAMEKIYYRLLKKLEDENFNIFDKKINISTFRKAALSLGVWAKYSLVY